MSSGVARFHEEGAPKLPQADISSAVGELEGTWLDVNLAPSLNGVWGEVSADKF